MGICSHLKCITQGKKCFVADLYIVPTWQKPTFCEPLASKPVSATCPTYFCSNDISCVFYQFAFELFLCIRMMLQSAMPLSFLCGNLGISCSL